MSRTILPSLLPVESPTVEDLAERGFASAGFIDADAFPQDAELTDADIDELFANYRRPANMRMGCTHTMLLLDLRIRFLLYPETSTEPVLIELSTVKPASDCTRPNMLETMGESEAAEFAEMAKYQLEIDRVIA